MKTFTFFCWWLIVLGACQSPTPVVKPRYQALTEAVYASGNLRPDHEYQVFALADGYLSQRLVDEGDTVHAGQPLFRIRSEAPDIRTRNARQAYQLALSNARDDSPVLEELRAGLAAAKVKMTSDSVNWLRYKNLIEGNATSRLEYDRMLTTYRASQQDYRSWLNKYEKTHRQLQLEAENARSNYQLLVEDARNFTLESRVNGRVYEVYRKEGEVVRRQEAVARIGDCDRLYLQLSVDELDVDKLRIGQEALVKIDTYRNRVFRARIARIYPMLNTQDQTFRVDAVFEGEIPAGRYVGLTVEANIIIHHQSRALTIPKAYLAGNDSVWISVDGRPQLRQVTRGIENFEWVEIRAGLDTTTVLIDPATISGK